MPELENLLEKGGKDGHEKSLSDLLCREERRRMHACCGLWMGRYECRRPNQSLLRDYAARKRCLLGAAFINGAATANQAIAAQLLAAIQALIGAAIQLLGGAAIDGPFGQAEGGRQGNVLITVTHRLAAQLLAQGFHQRFGTLAIGIAQQQAELLATQAAKGVGGAQAGA